MKVGVVIYPHDPWMFIEEIYEDWRSYYQVDKFKRRRFNSPFFYERINRYLFHHDLEDFMASNDVVFFEWASQYLVDATQLPKRAPIIVRLHRYELYRYADQVDWSKVDRVILVSQAMRRKFSRRFPKAADRTVVIHSNTNLDLFQLIEKPYNADIGTLCFPTPRKRVYELILAFSELAKSHPEFHLHIGGASEKFGDYNDALDSLVPKLGLQDKVTFYGDVSKHWEWFHNIDIFISNSYSEGLQVAPIEAMASGRYVLSHYWDGADELLPEDHLFLTDEQLREKILAYHDLPDAEKLRRQDAMRSRAVECFDVEVIKVQMRELIEEVAQNSPVVA